MRISNIFHTKNWRRSAIAILLVATFDFIGCTRTVIGGYVDSPDKKHRVYAKVYGAYGRSFLDETPKSIRINIVATNGEETSLVQEKYDVNGSDVGWDATWDKQNNLTVVFFEYPRGVNRWDLSKRGGPTNHIRTVIYRFNSKAGNFKAE